MFGVATLVAFFGACRIGELLVQSYWDKRNSALLVSDIVLASGMACLIVCLSKTDQRGVGHKVILHRSLDARLCPVQPLEEWL